jgi:hypothetical protein
MPVMVTLSPVFPEFGLTAVTLSPAETVKLTPLLDAPPTATTTFPVVAPLGTGTTMPVSLQLEGVATVLLNLTLLVPWVWPKAAPVMVTLAPIPPFAGETLVIPGPAATEKATPVLGPLGVVTTTFPVVAPSGTVVARLVEVPPVSAAVVPLNVTVFDPSVDTKLVPVIVTGNPAGPEVADKLVIVARETTVNRTPLLGGSAGIVTTTFPVVAPDGTSTSISLGFQSVGVAAVPLKVTLLVPWLFPKSEPKIETDCPTEPELLPVGVDRNEIEGGDTTVKLIPLLAAPPEYVTTTLPVDAAAGTGTTMLPGLQVAGVAVVPLNVTVVAPWLVPKPDPAIVTEVPAAPVAGDTLVRTGLGLSVKACGLVAWPPTVTTTFPLVDPTGGNATIWLSDHEVGVAGVPLNVTVLVPWESPKGPPLIWTEVPTVPELGDRLVMLGLTVKRIPLLSEVLKFASWYSTLTGLVTAHDGTATTKTVSLVLVGKAIHELPKKSLKTTTGRVPAALKPTPVIVMEFPIIPDVGDKFVISGMVLNLLALLATCDTATITGPVKLPPGRVRTMLAGLQLVGVTVMLLNVTVLVPWLVPKPVPVIVTCVPGVAVFGEMDEITGPVITVKKTAEPVIPDAVTVTSPLVAPDGTGTIICVGLQFVGVAAVVLNITVLVPWVAPKSVPVIVTDVPTRPAVGDKLEIFGVPGVAKDTPLLAVPDTVTITGPFVAPDGTGATMLAALQLVGVAAVPLNVTVLVPCVDPKFVPVIVTEVPAGPAVGDKLNIAGPVVTV